LTIDNLNGAEVVTAEGRLLRPTAQENPDLYRSLRGNGGNFGVVTSFEYRLHEVGPTLYGGEIDFRLPVRVSCCAALSTTWPRHPTSCV
jgi:FAD/FMN-containing dehydrogenase